jgi:Domain of unknown function (DUF4328)
MAPEAASGSSLLVYRGRRSKCPSAPSCVGGEPMRPARDRVKDFLHHFPPTWLIPDERRGNTVAMDAALVEPSSRKRPVCQSHTEAPAVGTCLRCGRFICRACVGEARICPECVQRQLTDIPSSAPRAEWATSLLTAHAAVDGLTVLLNLAVLGDGPPEVLSVVERFLELLGLGMPVLAVSTGITFLMWLHCAVRQAQALKIDVGVSPGWAVGYWFIPFSNLVKPYHTLRNLLIGLAGEEAVGTAHVRLWWGMWIAGNVLSQIETRMMISGALKGQASSAVLVVGFPASLLSVVGALLCIGVVRAIQRELDAKRR